MGWQWHQLITHKSFAPRSRQITTWAPHHWIFTGSSGTVTDAQPTVWNHWSQTLTLHKCEWKINCHQQYLNSSTIQWNSMLSSTECKHCLHLLVAKILKLGAACTSPPWPGTESVPVSSNGTRTDTMSIWAQSRSSSSNQWPSVTAHSNDPGCQTNWPGTSVHRYVPISAWRHECKHLSILWQLNLLKILCRHCWLRLQTFIIILWAGVQPTLDPYAEPFIAGPLR